MSPDHHAVTPPFLTQLIKEIWEGTSFPTSRSGSLVKSSLQVTLLSGELELSVEVSARLDSELYRWQENKQNPCACQQIFSNIFIKCSHFKVTLLKNFAHSCYENSVMTQVHILRGHRLLTNRYRSASAAPREDKGH
jgi:hypothetical protein